MESLCSSSKETPNSFDDMRRHGQDQRGHIGLEQPVESPSHAVVVEMADVLRHQAQDVGGVACGPFAYAVERFSGDEQIAEQDQEGLDRRELRAAVFGRQRGAQEVPADVSVGEFG